MRQKPVVNSYWKNEGKTLMECFDILISDLNRIQSSIPARYQDDESAKDRLQLACRDVAACKMACFKSNVTYEGLSADIRNSIATETRLENISKSTFMAANSDNFTNMVEQGFRGKLSNRCAKGYTGGTARIKRCIVCNKTGCWSTNHPPAEQVQALHRVKTRLCEYNKPHYDRRVQQYIQEYEGLPQGEDIVEDGTKEDSTKELNQLLMDVDFDDNDDPDDFDEYTPADNHFMTAYGEVNDLVALTVLQDNSTKYSITKLPITEAYVGNERYGDTYFHGIIVDTGAAKYSTGEYKQFQALQRIIDVNLDVSGKATVRFGVGNEVTSIGSAQIPTPIGVVTFYIMTTTTPFLLSIADMDRLGIYLNNCQNMLIHDKTQAQVPVIRKYGHSAWRFRAHCNTVLYHYGWYCRILSH